MQNEGDGMSDSTQVTFRIPKSDFERLKKICEKEDRTVSYFSRRAVQKEIERISEGDE